MAVTGEAGLLAGPAAMASLLVWARVLRGSPELAVLRGAPSRHACQPSAKYLRSQYSLPRLLAAWSESLPAARGYQRSASSGSPSVLRLSATQFMARAPPASAAFRDNPSA